MPILSQNRTLFFLSLFFVAGLAARFLLMPTLVSAPPVLVERVEPANPFEKLSVSAQAAYVYDITSGEVLYASREDDQLPLASLTKLMTVIVAKESLKPDTTLTISKDNVAVSGDSGLLVGEEWSLQDLVDLTLVGSSNDGAAALAETVKGEETFVDRMNKKARELGLLKTYFLNETGLDESGATAGAYGSARDIALLLSYAVKAHPDAFAATRYGEVTVASETDRTLSVANTNGLMASLAGALLSKTGTTPLAGGNLGVVFDVGIDHPVAVVLLGDHPERRFENMKKILSTTREFFATRVYE